jgi:PKD repeat protein
MGINVDALSSKLVVGTPLTAEYQWDFGDPGTQFDTMTGFNASHVYDTPGTYTITLTVTNQDGGVASATQQVMIAASTRKQIFVDSVDGSDSNPGTQAQPLQSFAQAVTKIGNNTEILFHAGETFNVLAGVEIAATNVVIGSYGSGANPVLNRIKGVGSGTFATWNTSNGVTFQNLTFDSPYGVGPNDAAPKTGVNGIDLAGQNMVVRNCTFLNIDDAINENGNPTGVLIQNNNAPLATGLRGYFVWGQGAQSVIVGNNVANSTREHVVRMVDMNEVTVEGNTFANLDRQNVDSGDYSKGCIEMHVGSYAYIADNVITDGDIRLGPLGLWGESPSDSTDWCVIKDNQLTGTDIYVNSGTHHAMVEGNVITNDSSQGIAISGPDSENRTSQDITVTHNTGIDNGTTGSFLYVAGYVDGITLTNNLWVAPNVGSSVFAVYVGSGDLSSFTTIGNNIWPAQTENATSNGPETDSQWNANSQVQNDTFETVDLQDTYQTTLGSLLVGSPMARAA